MKEVKHYICEICGTEYNDKKKCHVMPKEIVGHNHISMRNNASGYPTMVRIKMSNGETIIYKR